MKYAPIINVGGVDYYVKDEEGRQNTFENRNLLPSGITDLNTITDNSVYLVGDSSTADNKPEPFNSKGFSLITAKLLSNGSRVQQIAIGYSDERVFSRYCTDNAWSNWAEITAFQSTRVLPDGSDLDDLVYQTVATVQTGESHIPAHYPAKFGTSAGVIITLAPNNEGTGIFLIQIAISVFSNIILKRYFYNTWSEWGPPNSDGKEFTNKGDLTSSDDLDDVKSEGVYSVASKSPEDQPDGFPMSNNRAGFVVSSSAFGLSSYGSQMVLPYSGIYQDSLISRKECAMYMRANVNNEWKDWRYFKLTPRNAQGKYYAFGDSTTWGYSSDHSHAQSPWNYPAMIGDLIGVEVNNIADPAQGLLKNFLEPTIDEHGQVVDYAIIPRINDMIEGGDFDGTVLITVGWAYNDSSKYSTVNFGDPTDAIPDSNTGITTWLGYYARILKVLQEAAPGAMVMLITGYGFTNSTAGHKADNQFTAQVTFGDTTKTVREMYAALEEMANYNGFYCINQAKGTVINRVSANYIIGDNIHPTYDNYKIYGNFIASRVAAAFQNL